MVDQRTLSFAALGMSFAALVAALWVLLSGDTRSDHRGELRAGSPSQGSRAAGSGGTRELAARKSDAAGDVISGVVIDPESGPLEGGIVSFECVSTGRPIRGANVRLDESGAFETTGCGGLVCAQLRHPGYVQDDAWLLKPGDPADLFARRMAHLEGSVSADGAPVAGAQITVVPAEDDPMALPPLVSRNAQSDADGHFALARVELPPCDRCAEARGQCSLGEARNDVLYRGPLSLLVVAPGFRAFSRELEEMPRGPVDVELSSDLSPVTGTLRGAEGGSFARAEVLARSHERPFESHRVAVEGGSFELNELGDGPYTLRVLQDGIELLQTPGVEAGARLELVSEKLATGARVTVTVVNAQGEPVTDARVDGGPFGRGMSVDSDGQAIAEQVLPGSHRIRAWVTGTPPQRRVVEVKPSQDAALSIEL